MKKYLIVVDMQKDFVDGALGSAQAQAIVGNVVEKIKGWDGPIFVTRDTHLEDYLESREGKYLPVEHCILNSDGWQLDESVALALNEKNHVIFVNKPTFGSVKLLDIIHEMHNDAKDMSFELVGLCTDICVVSNAMLLKSAFPESDIAVDQSCCAGVTVEGHDAALATMKCCQIDII